MLSALPRSSSLKVITRTDSTHPYCHQQRCDELLSVKQPLAALSSISEVFSSKRFRTTPLSMLEPILIKFLGLCVDLRKGRTAKEGLHIYKNVAQNTSVSSVEVVITKFLEQSRAKLTEALAKVDELEGPAPEKSTGADGDKDDVEDLEASETPESILLSTVSEEKSRDRTYRTLVTPWLRFLWEAYRTALDTLRNNARLEVLYQTVCHDAFAFCLEHQRKTEFRRLAETLRSHLTSSQKYSHQSHSINLNDPDTLQRHLDTRFVQLNTAVELELWQEAFRTAEDIHALVGMSKRAPKASMMATFFDKMVKVFGVGQNYLFHAAAYSKLYALHAARVAAVGDKAEDAELEKLSSLVLLSALAVPLGSGLLGESGKRREVSEEGEAKGKLGRLAALLGLNAAPTRSGLLNDALSRHVLKRVSPELRELYNILEVDFHPLSITSKIEPILASLAAKPETARYVEPLKDVVLARLFEQLAQVYASLKIERVVKLASFAASEQVAATRMRVERFVTEACRRGDLDVTIDHATGSIKFDEDLFNADTSAAPIASTSAAPYEAKSLQPSAAALLRSHLARLAASLHATLDAVAPEHSPIFAATQAREKAFAAFAAQGADEREALIARAQIIKRRKELAEEQNARAEKEEAHQRTLRAAKKAEEDALRQKNEVRNRELVRVRREVEQVKQAEAAKIAESLVKGGLKVDMDKLPELSASDLVQLQVQQIEKDKKDLAQKLAGVNKRLDYLERAFRKEEIPLVKQDYERQQTRDRLAHESAKTQRAEQNKKQHAEALAIKQSLARLMPDYRAYKEKAEKESRAAYEAEEKRLAQALAAAKAERRQQVLDQRRREQEEEQRREQEKAERAERERAAAEAQREEEEREAAEKAAIEARQRQMEEEAEAARAAALAERKAEREKDLETVRLRQQREEEALARRQNRQPSGPPPVGSAEWKAARAPPPVPVVAASSGAPSERPRLNLAPRTAPVPAANGGAPPAAAAASSPAAEPTRPSGPPRLVGVGGDKPSWREREAARAASGGAPTGPPTSATPPPQQQAASGPPQVGGGKWTRRATGEAPTEGAARQSSGSYRPPAARTNAPKEEPRKSSGRW
ncbi:BZ3500_MvSof-1268-A1-R1_Chr1-3g02420 [Microbotryum saponariae]|uniref:Eukaryotic translation initiation factor 3 subunit A n=1 Tax=Microbotryum saponariae TaxID=289078 RepID=A0A2X0KEU3_9BASI|nr:BZ3500_MvSof-1268-A1-R1_Chr1-3g02420 [Microbotryum saponariae]SCZ96207.1 BZ3501_MvSof-1269-A2-R1_Chr1-3g02023 [Microbotryum saponariae]